MLAQVWMRFSDAALAREFFEQLVRIVQRLLGDGLCLSRLSVAGTSTSLTIAADLQVRQRARRASLHASLSSASKDRRCLRGPD